MGFLHSFIVIILATINFSQEFKARIKDASALGEVVVECKAELQGKETKYEGPLRITITFYEILWVVGQATWENDTSEDGEKGLSRVPNVSKGELCDEPFCIKFKQEALFNTVWTFICRVDDNGMIHEDRMVKRTEGTQGLSLFLKSIRFRDTYEKKK